MLSTESDQAAETEMNKEQAGGRAAGWGRDLRYTLLASLLVPLAFGFSEPLMVFYFANQSFDALKVGILAAVIYTSQTLAAPLMGSLADKLGRRNLLLLTVAAGLLAVLLPPLSSLLLILLVNRIIAGAANVGATNTILTLLTDETSGDSVKRGRATAIYQGATLGGQLIGVVLAGIIFEHIRLNSFYVAAIIYLIAFLLVAWRVAESKPEPRLRDETLQESTQVSWRVLLSSRQLWSFMPIWVLVNSILGMLYSHMGVQLLANDTHSNVHPGQYLAGRFTASQLAIIFLAYVTFFGSGLAIWGKLAGRIRYTSILLAAAAAEVGFCALLFAYNHLASNSLAFLLLIPAALLVLVESGFTPAALSYVTNVAEDVGGVQARGKVMGLFSTGTSLGNIIGSLLGIFFIQSLDLGLDGILLGCGLLGLIAAIAVTWLRRQPVERGKQPLEDSNRLAELG